VIKNPKPTLDEIKQEINDQMTMSGTFALIYKMIIELDMHEMETLHDDLFRNSRIKYTEYLKQNDEQKGYVENLQKQDANML
jgi:hypothetical protein